MNDGTRNLLLWLAGIGGAIVSVQAIDAVIAGALAAHYVLSPAAVAFLAVLAVAGLLALSALARRKPHGETP